MTLKFKGGILIKYNVKCRLKNASIVVNIPFCNLLIPETGLLPLSALWGLTCLRSSVTNIGQLLFVRPKPN